MNATTQHLGDLRSGKDQGGLWIRGYGTEQRLDTGASRAFQQQVNGLEIGADTALSFADGTLYVGGLLGKGQARQHFGEASNGTIDSATLGGLCRLSGPQRDVCRWRAEIQPPEQ